MRGERRFWGLECWKGYGIACRRLTRRARTSVSAEKMMGGRRSSPAHFNVIVAMHYWPTALKEGTASEVGRLPACLSDGSSVEATLG